MCICISKNIEKSILKYLRMGCKYFFIYNFTQLFLLVKTLPET